MESSRLVILLPFGDTTKVKDPNSVVPLHSPTRASNGEVVGVGVTVGAGVDVAVGVGGIGMAVGVGVGGIGVAVGVGWGVLHATKSSKPNVELITCGDNLL
jgi:hypothetical protein